MGGGKQSNIAVTKLIVFFQNAICRCCVRIAYTFRRNLILNVKQHQIQNVAAVSLELGVAF